MKVDRVFLERLINTFLSDRKTFKRIYGHLFDQAQLRALMYLVNKKTYREHRVTGSYLLVKCKAGKYRDYVVLIGHDKDRDTLFVNTIDRYLNLMFIDSDGDVIRELGYEIEVEADEYIVETSSDMGVHIRAQGDVVAHISVVDPHQFREQYVYGLLNSPEFANSVERYVAFRLMLYLQEYGLASYYDRHSGIVIPNAVRRYGRDTTKIEELMKKILEGFDPELKPMLDVNIPLIRGWGVQYGDITIGISPSTRTQLHDNIASMIMAELDSLVGEIELYHGRHKIVADRALPRVVRVTYNGAEFTASTHRVIFALPGCKMVFKHPEHGTRTVVFEKHSVVNVASTNANGDFNYHRIRVLIRELEEKGRIAPLGSTPQRVPIFAYAKK